MSAVPPAPAVDGMPAPVAVEDLLAKVDGYDEIIKKHEEYVLLLKQAKAREIEQAIPSIVDANYVLTESAFQEGSILRLIYRVAKGSSVDHNANFFLVYRNFGELRVTEIVVGEKAMEPDAFHVLCVRLRPYTSLFVENGDPTGFLRLRSNPVGPRFN